jgi:UDP-N-acetylmuramoylalanine--D-glutamate ligase
MELSSFQLETVSRSPSVAVLTNITPNHLDRHPSMEAYIDAKARIFKFQRDDDWAVVNADDPISLALRPPGRTARFSLERAVEGAYLDESDLVLSLNGQVERICSTNDVALRGRHNLANALTAAVTSMLRGATLTAVRQSLQSFRGLPHRLQVVGERDGITFVDDSIATSPERSMAALASFDQPIVLLAGGRDKHLPMDAWAELIRDRVDSVVLFGEASELIHAALNRANFPSDKIKTAQSVAEAASIGFGLARPSAVVLLSPGCTSYDQFRDFVERGLAFAEAVADIRGAER